MSREAERWLAEREIALLERIYELPSPPELEDWGEAMRRDGQRVVRVSKSLDRSRPYGSAP